MAKRRRTQAQGRRWQWREGGPKPAVEANVFAAELERLAGGDALELVEPAAIVAAARRRGSPIAPLFDFDIQRSAERNWLDQARSLVGRLQVVTVQVENGPTVSARGWYSVVLEKRRGYTSQDRIMSDRDLRTQTIDRAKNELNSFVAKYLVVIATIGNVVPRLQEAIETMQDEIERLKLDATARRGRRAGREDREEDGRRRSA